MEAEARAMAAEATQAQSNAELREAQRHLHELGMVCAGTWSPRPTHAPRPHVETWACGCGAQARRESWLVFARAPPLSSPTPACEL